MILLQILLLAISSFILIAGKDYGFHCKPKPGCNFSQCDPIPPGFLEIEGFDAEEFRRRNNYHILCEPKINADGKSLLKGEKGDSGPRGPEGMRGEDGIQGAKGEKGSLGVRGPGGKSGAVGEKGDAGAKGEKGESGSWSNNLGSSELSDLVKIEVKKHLALYDITARVQKIEALLKNPTTTTTTTTSIGGRTDLCRIYLDKKCYWVIQSRADYDAAKALCQKHGAIPGNIYSRNYYMALVNYVRVLISKETRVLDLWLGMTFEPKAKKMKFYDGSRSYYAHWHGRYPYTIEGRTQLLLQTDPYPATPVSEGMWNGDPSVPRDGVLCELQI